MATLRDEIENALQNVPKSIQNGPLFEEIKNVRNKFPIHRNCFQMKLVFVGKINVGKSTIINALLKKDCMPTGDTEVTINFFTIETTNKDREYFVITNRASELSPSENTNISGLKSVRRLNYNIKDFPDTDTIIKVYLDKRNEFLKDGVVLVDCPGYNRGYFETIKEVSKDVDVFTVVIDITEGSSEIDAENLKEILQISENGPICFIFNKCDDMSSKDKENAMAAIKIHFPNISRFNCAEMPVFFLCANKLFPGIPNGYNAEEFERYKRFLQNHILISNLCHKNRWITVTSKIKALADKIQLAVPIIDDHQYRDIEKTKQSGMNTTSHLSDAQLREIFNKIYQTVDANRVICYKDDAYLKVAKICDEVNKMISEFLEHLCLRKNEVITIKNGDAIQKAGETFYKTVFVASEVKINNYSWYNWGEKTAEVQRNFKIYLSINESNYKDKITSHYKEKVGLFLDHVLREREENIKYMETLRSLVPKLLQNT